MQINDRNQLKEYFKTNKRPTEAQFADLIDSLALRSEVVQTESKPYKVFSAMLSVVNNSLDPFNPNYVINHSLLEVNTIGELNIDFGTGNQIVIDVVSGEPKLKFERRFITIGVLRDSFNFNAITESPRVSDDFIILNFTIKGDGNSIPDPMARPEFYNLPIEIRIYNELSELIESDPNLARYRTYLSTKDLRREDNLLIPPYRFVVPDGRRDNEYNGSNTDQDLAIWKQMPDKYLVLPEINTDQDKNPHVYNLKTKKFACHYTYKKTDNLEASDNFLKNSVKKARRAGAVECTVDLGNINIEKSISKLQEVFLSGFSTGIERVSLIVNNVMTHYTRDEILAL